MQGSQIQTQKIALGGLAAIFDRNSEDKRCVLLVDHTGNAYTFFKYKARLIDVASLALAVNINKTSKEDAFQQIRKGLAYGIKQGEVVVLHFGENVNDYNQFMKGQSFWQPKELFKQPKSISVQWYRSKVMKPDDKDMFGNQGSLYPSDQYTIIISFSKNVNFEDFPWLKECKQQFRKVEIS